MRHSTKAVVLSCIDFRFQTLIENFIENYERLSNNFDHIAVAGGVKDLVDPSTPSEKTFLLEQLHISITLHNPHILYLINHEDCGAYGKESTDERHVHDLHRAYDLLHELYPSLSIRCYYARLPS